VAQVNGLVPIVNRNRGPVVDANSGKKPLLFILMAKLQNQWAKNVDFQCWVL